MGKVKSSDAGRLLNIIKEAGKPHPSTSVNMVWGRVESIAPLAIKIDAKTTIPESFLLLSFACQEQIIKIPTESIVKHLHTVPLHTTDSDCPAHPHTHTVQPFDTLTAMPEIRLWRGLEVGDNVRMLRINDGQKYYVLEREEGVPWYPTTAITDNK